MDNQLLNTILEICVPVVTATLVPLLFALIRMSWRQADIAMQTKAGAQWEMVKSIVIESVKYAEQLGLVKQGQVVGKDKLKLAVSFVESALKVRGIDLDLYPIIEMVEAAVMEEFNKEKLLMNSLQVGTLNTATPVG